MKKFWFVAALLLIAPAAFAKTPKEKDTATSGTLMVGSSTSGAEVFVDGERVGTVPLAAPLPFAPGEHTIKVVKPGFAPLIDVFTIKHRKETRVEAELTPVAGVLNIIASVEKTQVFIDGQFVGEAPLTVEMQTGKRSIKAHKGGYKDFLQHVDAVAGQEVNLEVKLEELPVELNPYAVKPLKPARWYEKWWVWTAAAGGVVAIVVIAVGVTQGTKVPDACSGSNVVGCFFVPVPSVRQ
jgi:hypothetical protein